MPDVGINLLNLLSKDPFIFTQQPDVFRVNFATSNDPFRIIRIHKMAQMVAKVILTTRGSDLFAPDIGTGVRSLISRFVSRTNLPTIKRDIALWIRDAERQLKEEQEKDAFPTDERVARLELVTAEFDFISLGWTIRVNVITEAGDEALLDITPQADRGQPDILDDTLGVRDVLNINTDPIP